MEDQSTHESIATTRRQSWFSKYFSAPRAHDLLAIQLAEAEAEIDLLNARAAAEHYTYKANMLNSRVSRLRNTKLEL